MRDRRRVLLVLAALFLAGLAVWMAYWLSPAGLAIVDHVKRALGPSDRRLSRLRHDVWLVAPVAYVALFVALLYATRRRRS